MRVGGGLFRWTRVCARTTARMYLTLEYSRHPLSPAVAGAEGGGEEKRRKDLFLDNREHGVSADKRIFRLTTRDHILQLMRLDLTPRYSSRNSSPSYFLRRYSVLISRSKASLLQSFSFFLSNCLVTSFEICFEKRKRKNCFPSSFLIA